MGLGRDVSAAGHQGDSCPKHDVILAASQIGCHIRSQEGYPGGGRVRGILQTGLSSSRKSNRAAEGEQGGPWGFAGGAASSRVWGSRRCSRRQ